MCGSTARLAVVALLGTAACGAVSTPATSTTGVHPAATSTTGATPTTGSPGPGALDGLRPFFVAADDVDARLAVAAAAVNRDVTGTTVVLDRATSEAIDAADPAVAAPMNPAGLPPDLERAVLVVYNDLVSRRGAFNGVRRDDTAEWLRCLGNGTAPTAHFRADVAAAETLAAATPPPPRRSPRPHPSRGRPRSSPCGSPGSTGSTTAVPAAAERSSPGWCP